MKKLTLDETWRLCISMWRWIAKKIKEGSSLSTETLKREWLNKHETGSLHLNCYFCEYYDQNRTKNKFKDGCNCPPRYIDESFGCCNEDYGYDRNPIAFYNKLVSLNRKRKKL